MLEGYTRTSKGKYGQNEIVNRAPDFQPTQTYHVPAMQGYGQHEQGVQQPDIIIYQNQAQQASQPSRRIGLRCPTAGHCMVCTRLCMME